MARGSVRPWRGKQLADRIGQCDPSPMKCGLLVDSLAATRGITGDRGGTAAVSLPSVRAASCPGREFKNSTRHSTVFRRSPVRTIPYRRMRMLFPNSRGY